MLNVYIVIDLVSKKIIGTFGNQRLANNMAELYTTTNKIDTQVTCHKVIGALE